MPYKSISGLANKAVEQLESAVAVHQRNAIAAGQLGDYSKAAELKARASGIQDAVVLIRKMFRVREML
jgi:hypothetical protein